MEATPPPNKLLLTALIVAETISATIAAIVAVVAPCINRMTSLVRHNSRGVAAYGTYGHGAARRYRTYVIRVLHIYVILRSGVWRASSSAYCTCCRWYTDAGRCVAHINNILAGMAGWRTSVPLSAEIANFNNSNNGLSAALSTRQ